MKKIFFVAFTFAGFCANSYAQTSSRVEALALPTAPNQPEKVTKDQSATTNPKIKEAEKLKLQEKAVAKQTKEQAKTAETSSPKGYKEAGLSDAQIVDLNNELDRIDKRAAEANANFNGNAEEKVQLKAKIQAEKEAVMKKIMGQEVYNNYNERKKKQMIKEKTKTL